MKYLIILWILNLTDLNSFQEEFKGTMNECLLKVYQIEKESKNKLKAGCYYKRMVPPYINKEN